MVKIHVKRGDESRFLFDTSCSASMEQLTTQLVRLHNAMLKVSRLCQGSVIMYVLRASHLYIKLCISHHHYGDYGARYLEIELLADHGALLPPQMQGLTDDQINELHLVDEWADKCVPSGGSVECNDPVGRRSGKGLLQNLKCVFSQFVKSFIT